MFWVGLNWIPSSSALISPWLLWRTLNPFQPFYWLINPKVVAIVLVFYKIAPLSVLVKASLPTIKRGSLADLNFSAIGWVPAAIYPRIVAFEPRC